MIDITGFVFLAIIGACLLKDWLGGDLYWCSELGMWTSRKIDRENSPARTGERLKKNSQGYYIMNWGDLKNERNKADGT